MRITIDIDPHEPLGGAVAVSPTADAATAPAELLARAAAMNAHNAGSAPDLSQPAQADSERAAAPAQARGSAGACGLAAAASDGITSGGAAAIGSA